MAEVQLKHNYIFISYEWVDHIAVYNYMFQPLIGHRQVVLLPVIK